jgi:hypothetical protein
MSVPQAYKGMWTGGRVVAVKQLVSCSLCMSGYHASSSASPWCPMHFEGGASLQKPSRGKLQCWATWLAADGRVLLLLQRPASGDTLWFSSLAREISIMSSISSGSNIVQVRSQAATSQMSPPDTRPPSLCTAR